MLSLADLWNRALAYKRVFQAGPDVDLVLRDLAKFCYVEATAHDLDDRDAILVAEGRRQVFWRIAKYRRLTPADLEKYVTEVEE